MNFTWVYYLLYYFSFKDIIVLRIYLGQDLPINKKREKEVIALNPLRHRL